MTEMLLGAGTMIVGMFATILFGGIGIVLRIQHPKTACSLEEYQLCATMATFGVLTFIGAIWMPMMMTTAPLTAATWIIAALVLMVAVMWRRSGASLSPSRVQRIVDCEM
ncbi:MAG: hypothetical protein ABIR91_03095 [Candidatus Saccharimonadales bacterium]